MLNQTEIDRLQIIIQDESLIPILEKILKETTQEHLPEISDGNDTELGQKYRAYITSQEILDLAFIKLKSYRKVDGAKDKLNRAR